MPPARLPEPWEVALAGGIVRALWSLLGLALVSSLPLSLCGLLLGSPASAADGTPRSFAEAVFLLSLLTLTGWTVFGAIRLGLWVHWALTTPPAKPVAGPDWIERVRDSL